MIKKVIFLDSVHSILEERLNARGVSCIHDYSTSKESIDLSEYDGIVIRSRFILDGNFLMKWPNLKFIARSGSGLENIDLTYCKNHNIQVFNSPEGNATAVAEHAIGMLLSLFNRLNQADREVKSGMWRREENRGVELEGKTVGIIGYGVMGSAFAKRLKGFDCKVLAYDKYKSGFGNDYVSEVDMPSIFENADVVSLHLPLNDETLYLVNSHWLGRFQKPIYLVNTSRGQVVKISDVIEKTKTERLLGLCLDVLEYEETSFEKIDLSSKEFKSLSELPHVVLSPHVAGWTKESYIKLSSVLADKIEAHFF